MADTDPTIEERLIQAARDHAAVADLQVDQATAYQQMERVRDLGQDLRAFTIATTAAPDDPGVAWDVETTAPTTGGVAATWADWTPLTATGQGTTRPTNHLTQPTRRRRYEEAEGPATPDKAEAAEGPLVHMVGRGPYGQPILAVPRRVYNAWFYALTHAPQMAELGTYRVSGMADMRRWATDDGSTPPDSIRFALMLPNDVGIIPEAQMTLAFSEEDDPFE